MPAANAITAAIAAFKAAKDVAQSMIDLRDMATFQAKMVEFQSKIIDANDAALTAQEERSALLERVGQLEKVVTDFKRWDAEKHRYSLEKLTSGSFVYALKIGAQETEPAHNICAACYQRDQKFILQPVHHPIGRSMSLDCPECGSRAYIEGQSYPGHVPPFKRR